MRYRKFRILSILVLFLTFFVLRMITEDGSSTPPAPVVTEAAATAEREVSHVPDRDAAYTTKEDVARYLFAYGTLPKNYMTKAEARDRGWDNRAGNLRDIADDAVIGGDVFRNFEKRLPDKNGRKWFEADVNYTGGHRGAERIVFSNDGLVYYTEDHYETFIELKPEDLP